MGRCNDFNQKLGSKQAHNVMHYHYAMLYQYNWLESGWGLRKWRSAPLNGPVAQEGLYLLTYYSQAENGRQWMNDTGGGFCSADAGLGDQQSLLSPADDTGLSLYFLSGLSQLRRWAANFFFKARAISAAGSEQSNSTRSRCTRNGVPPGDLRQLQCQQHLYYIEFISSISNKTGSNN